MFTSTALNLQTGPLNGRKMTVEVSVIIPCYNEEATIGLVLDALYHQTFPRDRFEVVIADGMSSDATRSVISEFHLNHPGLYITVVDNVARTIPSGLNLAIRNSSGRYIIRLDAHSIPDHVYITTCVELLNAGAGDNVGGMWIIKPGGEDWQARSIAEAATHPLAVGDARYRLGGEAQAVETVPFGAYRRDLISKIGGYNEALLTNEDYEFNVRIRQAGGVIWFDPKLWTTYIARSNFRELARQYWRYGYWKARMIKNYPSTLRWRQLLPPSFVLSILVLFLVGILVPYAWILLAIEIGVYLLVLLLVGTIGSIQKKSVGFALGLPVAISTMHVSWGTAFLYSLFQK